MSISKHVSEILSALRQHSHSISCYIDEQSVGVLAVDVSNADDESGSIIFLANGKKITTEDLEFALLKGKTIILGRYTFRLGA